MGEYLLGIDRGTTNIKAALYDLEGKEILVKTTPCEKVKSPVPGAAEQDMDRIWQGVADTVRALWNEGIHAQDVKAVGLSGQGGGLFLADKNGRPVRQGIVSLDQRAANAAAYWQKEHTHKEFLQLLEGGAAPNAPEILLYWIREFEPENYRRIRWIFQVKDWVRYRLTGEPGADYTEASNQFILGEDLQYSLDRFDACGLSDVETKFPGLMNPWDTVGTVTVKAAEETGLKEGTPVCAGGHDVAMVALGAGCVRRGDLATVMGTFGLNLLVTDCRNDEAKKIAKTVLSASPGSSLMMNGGSTGVITEWFLERFCQYEWEKSDGEKSKIFSLAEGEVLHAPDMGRSGVICHPFAEPPYTLPGYENSRFGLYGLTMGTTKAQIIRAFYEGIAIEMALSLEQLKRVEKDIPLMKLIGGGAGSRLWGQMFADACGITVEIPDVKECGCRGAALTAGIAAGYYKDHESAPFSGSITRSYFPGSEDAGYMTVKKARFCTLADIMQKDWNKGETDG